MDHRVFEGVEPEVTLFVACYNEEGNIVGALDTTVAACEEVGCSYEIIVIDDGSRDQSALRVKEYQAQHPDRPIRLVQNPRNRGLACNFVEGSFLGRGKYYRLVCGDNVEPLATQKAILDKRGQADMVIPYPLAVQNKTVLRKTVSLAFTFLVNLLSGYRLRYWNACALYHRTSVQRWHSNTLGFGFQAELTSQLLREGQTFVEVGCSYHERTSGKATALTLRNLIAVTHSLLAILLRRLEYLVFRKKPATAEGEPGTLETGVIANRPNRQAPCGPSAIASHNKAA
jgi:glycosyltransferase involved in cell wall biosynthesis